MTVTTSHKDYILGRQRRDGGKNMSTVESRDDSKPEPNVESYETDDGTVIYDSGNPLAWIKAEDGATQSLKERL